MSLLTPVEAPVAPSVYSQYLCVQLDEGNFGKSRPEHYKICNAFLLEEVMRWDSEGYVFAPGVMSNADLIAFITHKTANNTHSLSPHFVWEHCSSTTAGGQFGVMRLVPKAQHTPGSQFWTVIHRDYQGRGGYHEWAIPAGAPASNNVRGTKRLTEKRITQLKPEEFSIYFHRAVETNNYLQFQKLLEQARVRCSPSQIRRIFTEPYSDAKNAPTTLLHRAAKHAYRPILHTVLEHLENPRAQLAMRDVKGDTPAHLAAKNNRSMTLKLFMESGADDTLENKRKQTIATLVSARKFIASSEILKTFSTRHESPPVSISEAMPQKSVGVAAPATRRDPAFTYARPRPFLARTASTSTQPIITVKAVAPAPPPPPSRHASTLAPKLTMASNRRAEPSVACHPVAPLTKTPVMHAISAAHPEIHIVKPLPPPVPRASFWGAPRIMPLYKTPIPPVVPKMMIAPPRAFIVVRPKVPIRGVLPVQITQLRAPQRIARYIASAPRPMPVFRPPQQAQQAATQRTQQTAAQQQAATYRAQQQKLQQQLAAQRAQQQLAAQRAQQQRAQQLAAEKARQAAAKAQELAVQKAREVAVRAQQLAAERARQAAAQKAQQLQLAAQRAAALAAQRAVAQRVAASSQAAARSYRR